MSQNLIYKYFILLANSLANVVAILGKRTILLLATAFLIILTSIFLIDGWIRLFNTQTIDIFKSRNVLNNLYELKYQVVSAESAQRGYLLTHREVYLAPFNNAISIAKQNIENIEAGLANTIAAKQKSTRLLKIINARLEAKLAEMQATIMLAKSGEMDSAHNLIETDVGLQDMQIFNQAVAELISAQQQSIDTQVDLRNDNTFYARCLVIISSLIWLLLVVLALKQLMKEMTLKEGLKFSLQQEKDTCEKKLKDQNALVRTLALDYQADVERQRRTLSSELHDELGSIFTATKMDITWLIKKLKEPAIQLSPTLMIEKLQKTTEYINKGIRFHRQVIEQLNPAGLTVSGIWPTMRSLVTDAAERNNWQLTLDLPSDNTPLDETIALVTYRLVQETLNNANKYAIAQAVSVIVMLDDNNVKVEIEDDGIGIDLSQQKNGTHGIMGMKNRIVAIGGKFEITSAPQQGVLTRAIIPLNANAAFG